jgi:hypothetical protein
MTTTMPADHPQSLKGGACPNCAAELFGPFCASCGQRQVDLDQPLRDLVGEAMNAFLSFDARLLRTLTPLITRPGFLTVEFLAGRRKRYVHPFKLYFAISVALFLALSMSGYAVVQVAGDDQLVVTTNGATKGGEVTKREVAMESEAPPFLETVLSPLFELMENDPQRLNRIFIDRLARSVIILVPVFALLLRGLYWKRSYVSQLVFSLHLHSFSFFAIMAAMALNIASGTTDGSGPGDALSVVAIAVYTFLALRRVQGQGRLLTAVKMIVLLLGYIAALIATMILTLGLTALTV